MWIVLAIAALWLFYGKGYYAHKFLVAERGGNYKAIRFGEYLTGTNGKISAASFWFVSGKSSTPASRRFKENANWLLFLFYTDIVLMAVLIR